MARSGLEDLDRELTPYTDAPTDDRAAVIGLASAYLGFAERRPAMFSLITRHDLLDDAGGQLREITIPWFSRLTELTGNDPTAALALWSCVHGLAILIAQRSVQPLTAHPPAPGDVVELLVDRLMT